MRVAAVSAMLSPFAVELFAISRRITSPPRFLIAISKLLSVRVEFSKKIVIKRLFFKTLSFSEISLSNRTTPLEPCKLSGNAFCQSLNVLSQQ